MDNSNQFRGRRQYTASQQWDQDNQDYGNRQPGNNWEQENRGGNNRVNYIPDNTDNRDYRNQDYEGNMFDNTGTYGNGNRGAYRSGQGYQQDNEPDRYGNTSYGKQYYEERERMRNEWQGQNSANSYRNDYGRRDYGRSQLGHNFGSGGTNYQNQGYGSSADNYRTHYDDGSRRQSGSDDREGHGWWDRTRNQVASWFDDDDNGGRHAMEHMQQGSHTGKGPKGYQRSEERIREDICDRLSYDDRLDATGIAVEVQGTDVILTGLVSDKAEKRRAEDIAENIPGVQHVENRIRVDHTSKNSDSWGSSIGL